MKITENIKKIIKHFNNKDYLKVMEICEKIIKFDPNISETYNFYGLALQNLKK